MITEFTCGIFKSQIDTINSRWVVYVSESSIGHIIDNGEAIKLYSSTPALTKESLIEIAVLMNNIKRQYKQLQK